MLLFMLDPRISRLALLLMTRKLLQMVVLLLVMVLVVSLCPFLSRRVSRLVLLKLIVLRRSLCTGIEKEVPSRALLFVVRLMVRKIWLLLSLTVARLGFRVGRVPSMRCRLMLLCPRFCRRGLGPCRLL